MEGNAASSRFIVFEGLDGSGKSSVVRRVKEILDERGRDVLVVTDPPLIDPWDRLKDYFEHGQQIDKIAEAVMLVAARIDNSRRVISRSVEAGSIVLADRYYPSWLAYQQVQLSDTLGSDVARTFLRALQVMLETHNLLARPNLIIFLEGNLDVFAERLRERGEGSKYDNVNFQRRVAEEYRRLLQNERCAVAMIDTSTMTLDETVEVVLRNLLA